jgi:hypothetical protein
MSNMMPILNSGSNLVAANSPTGMTGNMGLSPSGSINGGLSTVPSGKVSAYTSGSSGTGTGTVINSAPVAQGGTTGTTVPATTSATGVAAGNGNSALTLSGQQSTNLNKQLTDTFGKGEGGLLDNEISNLGSDDSTYMQAYSAAMAGQNAENSATLNTTLGNQGIGANSSTSAIANADFQTGITSQEGLQEQNLQQDQISQLLGVTTGLENQSASEVSSGGFMNDLGSVLSAAGSDFKGIASGVVDLATL